MIDHLWQSTLFAAAMALGTVAFRSNRASVRHAMWLAASLKFLIPFSLLVSLGSQIEWRKAAPRMPAPMVAVMQDFSTPPVISFGPPPVAPAPARQIDWPLALWAVGCSAFAITWLMRWLRVRSMVRAATPLELNLPIRAAQSTALLEPGVYGIFRPILLLPEGIAERLTPAQVDAVIQHELCHVRRYDNLIATIQMAIESVFWFHPLVWWIGKRMIAERERACDEAVVQSGREPHIYAEAILNVCKLYLESPMPCVAGVTGAGLKQRIEAIVSHRIGGELGRAKKFVLATAAFAIVAAPIAIGILNAPAMRAQSPDAPKNIPKWEAVSIHPCASNSDPGRSGGNAKGGGSVGRGPGRINLNCQTAMGLMQQAYGQFSDGRRVSFVRSTFEGAPAWTNTERFAIEGKAETPEGRVMMQGPMMQQLLAERFKLKIRREVREMPVYNLTVAKGGPKSLKTSTPQSCIPIDFDNMRPPQENVELCEMIGRGVIKNATQGEFMGFGFTMPRFAEQLGALIDRPVIDKTGLTGKYDFKVPVPLESLTPPAPDPHPDRPMENYRDEEVVMEGVRQLGLKLESAKGPGIVYVIESIERPTDNFTPPQAQVKRVPKFEVVSIHPGCVGVPPSGPMQPPPQGRLTGCFSMQYLIVSAYSFFDHDHPHAGFYPVLPGGPDLSATYRIDAKAEGTPSPEMIRGPMLQALLEDRFKLKVHWETRESPVFALTVAKGGSKLQRFQAGTCTPSATFFSPIPGPRGDKSCPFQMYRKGALTVFDFKGMTPNEFFNSPLGLDRTVIDRTGLTGLFNFRIEYTRDADRDKPDAGPSIFTAVQQQLGLKLDAARGPRDYLVVDHIEKPTEN